jgi:hypothetical protein
MGICNTAGNMSGIVAPIIISQVTTDVSTDLKAKGQGHVYSLFNIFVASANFTMFRLATQ